MHTVKNHGTFNKYTMYIWDSEQMHVHMKRKLQQKLIFALQDISIEFRVQFSLFENIHMTII